MMPGSFRDDDKKKNGRSIKLANRIAAFDVDDRDQSLRTAILPWGEATASIPPGSVTKLEGGRIACRGHWQPVR
jgi:hypothetical protein